MQDLTNSLNAPSSIGFCTGQIKGWYAESILHLLVRFAPALVSGLVFTGIDKASYCPTVAKSL